MIYIIESEKGAMKMRHTVNGWTGVERLLRSLEKHGHKSRLIKVDEVELECSMH